MNRYLPILLGIAATALLMSCGCLGHYLGHDGDATINVVVTSDSHYITPVSDGNMFSYNVTKVRIDDVCDRHGCHEVQTVTDRQIVTSSQGSPTEIELSYITSGSYWRLRWHGRDGYWYESHWTAPSDENSYVIVQDYNLPSNYIPQTPQGFHMTSDQCGQTVTFRYYRTGQEATPTPTPILSPTPTLTQAPGTGGGNSGGTGGGFVGGSGNDISGYIAWADVIAPNNTYEPYTWIISGTSLSRIQITDPTGTIVLDYNATLDERNITPAGSNIVEYWGDEYYPLTLDGTWTIRLLGIDEANGNTPRVLSADKIWVGLTPLVRNYFRIQ